MSHNRIRMLVEGAIMIAAAQVLSYLKLWRMPWGGSITLAMLPIVLYAVRWGFGPGLLAGFVLGILQFTLDDGSGKDRTILSGIAQWYEPEQLVGKRVLFIANLAPRQMMGEESCGMILSAVNYNGDLSVTTTLDEVKGGSQVG